MSESDSTLIPTSGKPSKPYPRYPLTPHPAGYWCKKIRGKLHYFGKWADPDGALANYESQKEDLHAGRKPRPDPAAIRVKDLVNAFLNYKKAVLNSGELSQRTWCVYKETCDLVLGHFGKERLVADLGQDDFADLRIKMALNWGPYRLANMIQYVRSVFKYGYDSELLERPMRFGPGFKRPSKKTIRLQRAEQGPKLFSAEEIRKLLDAAGIPMKAMILLGINCGFGNSDCANLPLAAINLDTGWIDYPRPKTGIPRLCPLWSETVAAIKEALIHRYQPKKEEHQKLVFVTKYGDAWFKDTSDSPIAKEMAKLLRPLGIKGRKGLGFYTLRHTFRTVADEIKDQPAIDFIMGHEVQHMSSVYRETISRERLMAVVDGVRKWLFGK